MTKLDMILLVVAVGALAATIGGLGLCIVVERLQTGRWPWLVDWLARRKWRK